MQGFHIILLGQCSRHLSMRGMLGKAMRQKILRSQTKVPLDDDYPKYMDRKIKRLDSMDFSPKSMMEDIQAAI